MGNAFSSSFDKSASKAQVQRGNAEYGMPKKGTATYQRMLKAQKWAAGKLDQLYKEFPNVPGCQRKANGDMEVKFKDIFEHYADIDTVIVGTLQSAKKKGLAEFDNGRPFPLLQQGFDDNVIITLHPRKE